MDPWDPVAAIGSVSSAVATLAAVGAALWAAVVARADARQANARLFQWQEAQEGRRVQEQADARAGALAEHGAGAVFIATNWNANIDADHNSFGFTWSMGSTRSQQIRVVAARTVPPLVRSPSDLRPRDLLAEAGGPFDCSFVTPPPSHTAQASFTQDADITQPPPLEVEFVDQLDNRWSVTTARSLTLLTPRRITAELQL